MSATIRIRERIDNRRLNDVDDAVLRDIAELVNVARYSEERHGNPEDYLVACRQKAYGKVLNIFKEHLLPSIPGDFDLQSLQDRFAEHVHSKDEVYKLKIKRLEKLKMSPLLTRSVRSHDVDITELEAAKSNDAATSIDELERQLDKLTDDKLKLAELILAMNAITVILEAARGIAAVSSCSMQARMAF